jgi:hypothetical protein
MGFLNNSIMDKQNGIGIQWVRSAINTSLLMVLLTVLISSCYYRENEVLRPEPPPEDISYSEDIQPIWDARCNSATCHGGRWAPNLLASVSYNELIGGGYVDEQNPAGSIIYEVCVSGGSMVQYTEVGDAEKILKWIEDGAQNN